MTPASHRIAARKRWRGALVAIAVTLLVLAVALAVAWPRLEAHVADRKLRQLTDEGLDFHTVTRIDGSTWRLYSVAVSAGRWTIDCDHVTARINRSAVARGERRAESIAAGTCTMRPSEDAEPIATATTSPHGRSSIEERVTEIIEHALAYTSSLTVDRLGAPLPDNLLISLGLLPASLSATDFALAGQADAWSASTVITLDDNPHELSLVHTNGDLVASHAGELHIAHGPLHLRSDEASLLIRDDALILLNLRVSLGQAEDATAVHVDRATLEPLASPPRLHIRGAAIDASLGLPVRQDQNGPPEPPPTLAEQEEDDPSVDSRTRAERLADRAQRARESRAALMDFTDNAIDLLLQARALGHRADQLRLPIDLTIEDLVFGGGEDGLRLHRLHMAAGERPRIEASIGESELSLRPSEEGDWHLSVEQWPLSGIHPMVPSGLIDLDVRILGYLPNAEEGSEHPDRGQAPPPNGVSPEDGGSDSPEEEPLGIIGRVHLRQFVVDAPAIAPGPVGPLDLDASAELEIHRGSTIRASLAATIGLVQLDASLHVGALSEGERLTLDAGFSSRTLCQDAWRSVPEGLLPTLGHRGIRWSGTLRPRASLSYTIGTPTSFRMTVAEEPATCEAEWIRRDMDPEQLNSPNWVHHVHEGTELENLRVGPGTEHFVPLERLPSYVPALMYLSEEMAFFRNRWISIPLLNRAIRMNLERGYYVYGGSTVSQQLVKNLFLTREKHLARKLEEAILVWVMEERVSKARILELYVNCIEFGPDIFGIRAASHFYFDAEPWEISPLEAAFLAALKPSPRIGGPWRRRGETPARGWFPQRIETLLERAAERGGHIPHGEIAHYAPFVVRFPHPDATHSNVRIPRPEGSVFIPFDADDPERLEASLRPPPSPLDLLPRPSLIRDGATQDRAAPNP